MIEVTWVGVETPTREQCRIAQDRVGVLIDGRIEQGDDTWAYTLQATPGWEFRGLDIRSADRVLTVRRTTGVWTVDGVARTDLQAALEVDLSASPISNTLPIRRLGLEIGDSADIVTAYVRVPELVVAPDPQRYTRTGAREYLYESRDSDFRRLVTVDDRGLVLEYPGLFTRE